MKRFTVLFMLVVGICGSIALGDPYTWFGDGLNANWTRLDDGEFLNWDPSTNYPGHDDNMDDDDVLISKDVDDTPTPVVNEEIIITNLVVRDGDSSVKVTLTLNEPLNVEGNMTVQDGSVDDGSSLELYGDSELGVTGFFMISGGSTNPSTLAVFGTSSLETK